MRREADMNRRNRASVQMQPPQGHARRWLSVLATVAVLAFAPTALAQPGDPDEEQINEQFAAGLADWWDMSGGFSLANPGFTCAGTWGDSLVYDQSGAGAVIYTDSIPGAPGFDPADWYNFRFELDFVLAASADSVGVVWWLDDPASFDSTGVATGGYKLWLTGAPSASGTPASGADLYLERDIFDSTADYSVALENPDPLVVAGDPEWTVYQDVCYRLRVDFFCGELTVSLKRLDTGGDWLPVFGQTFGGNPPGVLEKVGDLGLYFDQGSSAIAVDNVSVMTWEAACETCTTGWSDWTEAWTSLDDDWESARDRTAMVFRQVAALHGYRNQMASMNLDWAAGRVLPPMDATLKPEYLSAPFTCVGGRALVDIPGPFDNRRANVPEIRSYMEPMASSIQVTQDSGGESLVFMPQHDDDNPIPVFANGDTPIADALMDVYDWYQEQIDDGSGGDEGAWFRDPLAACRRWYIILITDGEESCAATQNAVCQDAAAGGLLQGAGVPVYTIGFSSSVSENSPLKCLSRTGGLFQTAAQATQLLDALDNILSQIDQVDRAFAPVAVTPQNALTETDRLIFLPRFTPRPERSIWEGSLWAFGIDGANPTIPTVTDADTGKTTVDFSAAKWNAKSVLWSDGAASRKIFYASPGSVPETRHAYDFDTASSDERDELASWLGPVSATHTELEEVMDFITGEDRPDQAAGEPYQWLLGDIFHSSPVVVAAPGNYGYYLNNTNGYVDDTGATGPNDGFMHEHKYRRRVVLVGGNDALLHAFDGGFWGREAGGAPADAFDFGSGRELFAHIPREVMSTTWSMTNSDPADHHYTVDGYVTADDVYISPDGGTAAPEWRTVAVYGLRRGGRSVVALDVTQPDPYTDGIPTESTYPGCLDGSGSCNGEYPKVLWEFEHTGLGETWSRPAIARIENSTSGDDIFIAFFGGGWDAGSGTRGDGVFGVNIETGALAFYSESDAATEVAARVPGGVVALDTDDDGYTERLYFADVEGGVWRIDTDPATPNGSGEITSWSAKKLAFFGTVKREDDDPCADTDPAEYTQNKFFVTPTLVPAKFQGSDFLWGIAIGTGNREDISVTALNCDEQVPGKFYFILDDNDFASTGTLDESNLLQVAVADDPQTGGATALDPTNNLWGWVLELEHTEKVTTQAIVLNEQVQFPTFKPVPPDTGGGSGGPYTFDPSKACIVESRADDPFSPTPDDEDYPLTYQFANEDAARAWVEEVDGDGNPVHSGDYLGECKVCRAAGTVRIYDVSYYNADPPEGEERFEDVTSGGFIGGGTVYTVGDKTIASWTPMEGPPITTEAVNIISHRVTNWRQE
jgi:hypothetical protein